MLTTLRFAFRSLFWLDWRLDEGATREDQFRYVFYLVTGSVLAVFVVTTVAMGLLVW